MKILLTILVVVFFTISCSFNDTFHSELEYIVTKKVDCKHPPKPENVKAFRSSQPSRPFTEIGTVTSLYSSYSKTLMKLQEKASENCADGLIDIRESAVGLMTRLNATAVKFE